MAGMYDCTVAMVCEVNKQNCIIHPKRHVTWVNLSQIANEQHSNWITQYMLILKTVLPQEVMMHSLRILKKYIWLEAMLRIGMWPQNTFANMEPGQSFKWVACLL